MFAQSPREAWVWGSALGRTWRAVSDRQSGFRQVARPEAQPTSPKPVGGGGSLQGVARPGRPGTNGEADSCHRTHAALGCGGCFVIPAGAASLVAGAGI